LNTIEFDSASPEQQYAMKEDRLRKEKDLSEYQKNKRIEDLERRIEEREETQETQRWEAIGTQLLQKYSMENYVSDKEHAAELNQELWESTWNALAKLPDDVEWTPAVVEKIMRKKASLFRGGMEQAATAKVQQITDDKKAKAKEQAQAVARRNISTNQDDMVSRLKGSNSAMDRINMLSGRWL
jgi:hypothetical protein